MAVDKFNDYFNYTIQNWLNLYPPEAKNKDGAPFWSGPKRCPSIQELNLNN